MHHRPENEKARNTHPTKAGVTSEELGAKVWDSAPLLHYGRNRSECPSAHVPAGIHPAIARAWQIAGRLAMAGDGRGWDILGALAVCNGRLSRGQGGAA